MAIPANHRLTHVPTYIFAHDDAIDREKVDRELAIIDAINLAAARKPDDPELDPETAELAALPCAWAERDDHPMERFASGRSRFDLATIRDYLKPNVRPTFFVLRRMTFGQWQAVQASLEREVPVVQRMVDAEGNHIASDDDGNPLVREVARLGRTDTLALALRHTLESCDDLGIQAKRTGLTDEQLESIRDQLGDHALVLLGMVALNLCRSMSPEESFR